MIEKCGCSISHDFRFEDRKSDRIVYCPLHANAGKLLEVAKKALMIMPGKTYEQLEAIQMLKEAIRATEGKP